MKKIFVQQYTGLSQALDEVREELDQVFLRQAIRNQEHYSAVVW